MAWPALLQTTPRNSLSSGYRHVIERSICSRHRTRRSWRPGWTPSTPSSADTPVPHYQHHAVIVSSFRDPCIPVRGVTKVFLSNFLVTVISFETFHNSFSLTLPKPLIERPNLLCGTVIEKKVSFWSKNLTVFPSMFQFWKI